MLISESDTGNVQVSETYLGSPNDLALSSSNPLTSTLLSAWQTYASTARSHGTPTLVQLCHPGRQSPLGAGSKSFFTKNLAPSATPLYMGSSWLAWFISRFIFGTPKAMDRGNIENVIAEFVSAAKRCEEAGFDGVELHAAHGYLLSQFLTSDINDRSDEFGGSPEKRAGVALRIIKGIRAITKPSFAVGIKFNSVDLQVDRVGTLSLGEKQRQEELALREAVVQIQLLIDAGIDFLEVSGGSYEKPLMMQDTRLPVAAGPDKATTIAATDGDSAKDKLETEQALAPVVSTRTAKREAFFTMFCTHLRQHFPQLVIMSTGGFRSRLGMAAALADRSADLIGVGRPAVVLPKLPRDTILNPHVADGDAVVRLNPVLAPQRREAGKKWLRMDGDKTGAGAETAFYSAQIQRMGVGQSPIFA
jgi:2,4-dienoyl-CoA reductase-like NADH-dependent reductase (Old Yellow Enzyme family)